MLITKKQIPCPVPRTLDENSFFLCLDTTGLQADASSITMIGIGFRQGEQLMLMQWFNESGLEQKDMLVSFFDEIDHRQVVITHYGNRFSLPFLQKKSAEYGLTNPIDTMISKDYYDMIYPFRKILALSSCRQTALEQKIGFKRTISMTGKKRIQLYQTYLKKKDASTKKALLLYNEETLLALWYFSSIPAYLDLKQGKLSTCGISKEHPADGKAVFTFSLSRPLLLPLDYTIDDIHLLVTDQYGTLIMPLDEKDRLKHYYPDVKNYYYLPVEDRAIHKSLASFVPRDYRQKATWNTCYEKLSFHHPAFQKEDSLKQFLSDVIAWILLERKDGRS